MSRPQFPDPMGVREVVRPGATAHKSGADSLRRIQNLEQGAAARPGPGVTSGSVLTSDTTQTGGVKWSPYYSTAWTTVPFATGWSDYGATYGPPQYSKTRDGVVSLRGLAKKANVASSSGVICTLPVGFRPPTTLIFSVHCNYSALDRPATIYVDSGTGTVTLAAILTGGGTANYNPVATDVLAWASLSNITFDTA